MCDFEVDDPATWSTRVERTARKAHRCNECGAAIRPRDVYFLYTWMDSGSSKPDTAKNCWDCEEGLQLFREHHRAYWFPCGLMGSEYKNCARDSESFAEMMMWGRLAVAHERRQRAASVSP